MEGVWGGLNSSQLQVVARSRRTVATRASVHPVGGDRPDYKLSQSVAVRHAAVLGSVIAMRFLFRIRRVEVSAVENLSAARKSPPVRPHRACLVASILA